MIAGPLHSVLIFVSILHLALSAEPICCCPEFDISLNCTNVAGQVKLVNNGFRCLAKSQSDVTLNCKLGGIENHPDISEVEYVFLKAKEVVHTTPFTEWPDSKEVNDTACGRSNNRTNICKMTSVKWNSEINVALTDHDSLVYQCLAFITLRDDSTVKIYSNTMWLDVQSNIDTTAQAITTGSASVFTAFPETKLPCAILDTNPPSKAVWSKLNGTEWDVIDLVQSTRIFVVEKVIHSTSTSSSLLFKVGTLVIMFFKAGDDGLYQCDVKYTDGFGTSTTYKKVNNYTLTRNTAVTPDKGTAALVSQITEHTYISEKDNSSFTCHGRDVEADAADAPPYRYSWSYKNGSNYVSIDESSKPWPSIEFSSYNRTMSFTADHNMTGKEFFCTVTKTVSSAVKTIKSDKFVSPAILAEKYLIPSSSNQCHDNTTKNLIIIPNVEYFADPDADYNSTVSKQNLSGTTLVWMEGSTQISTFVNTYEIANGKMLKMNFSKEASNTNKCRYFQMFRTYSKLYQMQEVFGVIRPNAPNDQSATKCGAGESDVKESDITEVKCTSDGTISVTFKKDLGCFKIILKIKGSSDIITEKLYRCSTAEVSYNLCNINKECSVNVVYDIEWVLPGSTPAIIKTFNTGTICNPIDPPPTSSCPDSSAKNISDFIHVSCKSVVIKKGCWDVSYWETGGVTKTNSSKNCKGTSVAIPDKYKSSVLQFSYKCYENDSSISDWNLSSMKNVNMSFFCQKGSPEKEVIKTGKDWTVIVVVIIVVIVIFTGVTLVVCVVFKSQITRTFSTKQKTVNDSAPFVETIPQVQDGLEVENKEFAELHQINSEADEVDKVGQVEYDGSLVDDTSMRPESAPEVSSTVVVNGQAEKEGVEGYTMPDVSS